MKINNALWIQGGGKRNPYRHSRKHRILKVKGVEAGPRRRGREQPCERAQQMRVLRVWSMAVAVCSAHQRITALRGAFIPRCNMQLMKSEKWLPLISVQWPPVDWNDWFRFPFVTLGHNDLLDKTRDMICASTAGSHPEPRVKGMCVGWFTVSIVLMIQKHLYTPI